ncbi:TorD/DmsD family molecular chaperone [Thauera mechernichensis]
MAFSPQQLATRAELQLCLARCFLPPREAVDFLALRVDLPSDLRELNAELAVLGDAEADELCAALATLPNHAHLLTTYSRLFLAPPAPALLSLGFYLDGGLMGGTCQAIERLYQRHGLQRDAAFRDTADHLALYLQFMGWLMARAADELNEGREQDALALLADAHQSIVCHGLPALQRLHSQIVKAQDTLQLEPIYARLCSLAHAALAADAHAIQALLPHAALPTGRLDRRTSATLETTPLPAANDGPCACSACSKPFVASGDLAGMIAILEAQGLSTDHMRICPDCRSGAMGMTPLSPPPMRKAI